MASPRTKRNVTLVWTALFVLSLVLQSVQLAAPRPVSATPPGAGVFQLDGDAVTTGNGDDWEDLDDTDGSNDDALARFFVTDTEDHRFTGGSKDTLDMSQNAWDTQASPDKDDILHAFAGLYGPVGAETLVFGMDRLANNGDANVGFWFFQGTVGQNANGTFSGTRTPGDIFVVSEFSGGGDVSTIVVYEWTGSGLSQIASGVECANGGAVQTVCAIVNDGDEVAPWPYTPKSGTAGTFPIGSLFEGGLLLDALFPQDAPCFSSFLAETRSSTSTTAELKNFVLGNFDTCGSVTIVKDAIPNAGTDFSFDVSASLGADFLLDDDADATLSNTKTFSRVNPGTYTATEIQIPGGWDLTAISCDDGSSATPSTVNLGTATATIKVDPVEDVTCTFTNRQRGSITIVKDAQPNDPQDFAFSGDLGAIALDDDGNATLPNSQTFSNLVPGSYAVTEAATAGWDLTALSCDDGDGGSTTSLANRTATIDLDPGQHITCTYVNSKRGSIVITKDAVPNGPQDFTFSASDDVPNSQDLPASFDLDDDADGTLPSTRTFTNVTAGTYTVTEAQLGGWDLTNLVCSDPTSDTTVDLAARTATIRIGLGETVSCTFTNTQRGRILVDKVTVPAGDPQLFTFDPSWSGTDFQLADATTPHDSGLLVPGTYSVSEVVPAGWDLTGTSCSDGSTVGAISLQPGETVTCTFTNTKRARVIVDKVTVPAGDPQLFTFDPSWSGTDFQLADATTPHDSGALVPGTYSVSETVPAGWDNTAAVCSDGSPVGAISLQPGETVTCTFTNVKRGGITIIKVTDPAADPQDFTYTVTNLPGGSFALDTDPGSAGTPNAKQYLDLVPGSYSVTELATAGWDLVDLDCETTGGSSAQVSGATASLTLAAGGSITCTYVNQKDARIVVVKQTDPDGDPAEFGFDASWDAGASPDFLLNDGESQDSGDLDPGTYSVAELAKAGWDLISATCDDGSAVGAISLQAGEVVTCTFTNQKDARIIVVKQTDPDGDTQVFDFDASWDAGADPDFGLADGQQHDSGDLDPGTYAVSEAVPAGWDLIAASCSDGSTVNAIALSAGETVTCTFTNQKDARIVVVKQTDPDGDPQVFDFDASWGDGDIDLADGQSEDSGDLAPGTYSVAENVPAGWDLVSATCDDGSSPASIGLAAGEVVTCTFLNQKDARIVVVKQTDPDGDPAVFHFDADYDQDGFDLSDGEQHDSGDLDPGTYTVSEDALAGWDLTSETCSDGSDPQAIGLAAGEVVTCTFVNTKRGTIVVEKQTSPDGATDEFTFTGDAAGSIADDGTITVGNLVPGTYTSTETDPGADWDLQAITCEDSDLTGTASSGDLGDATATFELDPGETVRCVFRNAQRGTLTIIKDAIPDDPQDFAFGTTGAGLAGFSLDDDADPTLEDSRVFTNLVAGTYSVTELATAGWDLTDLTCVTSDGSSSQVSGATASITLANGGSATCTYENTKRGRIVVEKQTLPNGAAQSFVFTASYDADGFSLTDGAQNDSGLLVPGTYSVAEVVPAGWDLIDVACSDESAPNAIDLAPGETVTCVFTNARPSISVVKTAASASGGSAPDGGTLVTLAGPVTYTYVVTNTGPIALQGVTVRDDNGTPGTTADDFSATCPKTTLAAGESMTCSATIQITSNRTNIATARGTSEGGTTVQDTDDAIVVLRTPGIAIVKTNDDADGVVGRGQTVGFDIVVTVTNGPVSNAVVTDTLPAGQTYKPGTQTSNPAAASFSVSPDGRTLTWTWASLTTGATIAYDVTIDASAPTGSQTNVAEICVDEVPTCDDDDSTVRVPQLTIEKANDAPLVGGLPTAQLGQPVTFTLTWTLTNGPVTGAVITDVLPVGLTYMAGTASSNAPFTFQGYDASTRTLRWTAPTLASATGTQTYQAFPAAGASDLPQPLINVATIDSNETPPDGDESPVFVPEPPRGATATPRLTLPPTDALDGPSGPTNLGFSLMLVLLALAAITLAVALVTPAPTRVRAGGRRR